MTFAPAPPGIFALPLGSVDAVAFDTETTGLDTRNSRIIEIAGIRLVAGRIEHDSVIEDLINPGTPIPRSSTDIHGITDDMVVGASEFRQGLAGFQEWTGPALLLGYSVDFDLAVLEAEHRRLGMLWTAPDVLDVQELAQAIRLPIEDWTMESVANWLSIEIDGRHRALADARLTAEIFDLLVPMLREAGVTTVGQAKRVCEANQQQAAPRRQQSRSRQETASLDSLPYRYRVKDVMSSPPVLIDRKASLRNAVASMVDRGITSLFVTGFEDGEQGILTESDIMRAISGRDSLALDERVGQHCSRPLQTVDEKEFVYRAIVSMTSRQIRHLGVVDPEGRLVGAVTAKDAFSSHGSNAVSLGTDIEFARNSAELGRVWSELGAVARSLIDQSVEPRMISAIISRELRALTEKACQIALSEIADRTGDPPVPFAVMVLGSGGRGESLLAMDQDNAVVFEGREESAGEWFREFGKVMTSILNESGVVYCRGGVMASNPDWCRHSGSWRDTVSRWMAHTSPSDLMNVDIFFDAMPVYGQPEIADGLRESALEAAMANRSFLALLAKRACDINSPFGLFGRWKLDRRSRVDLKWYGLMPLFSAARALALEQGISARSTAGRLNSAVEAGACDGALAQDLIAAQGIIQGTILRQQLRDSDRGTPLSSSVVPSELSSLEKRELKWAILQVARVPDLLGVPTVF